jgi:hypothetical protein
MTVVISCIECNGSGRHMKSTYGGNDPDVWDAGPCEACDGTGDQCCEECCKEPAVTVWRSHRQTWLVCEACHADWLEDAA